MNRKLIFAALVVIPAVAYSAHTSDAARVRAAEAALARDADAAARAVAGGYTTTAHLDLWNECAPARTVTVEGLTFGVPNGPKPEVSRPHTVHLNNPNTPLPPLRDLVAAVSPCYLAGTSVAAMEPVPPADPEGTARTRLDGPYRAAKVAVTADRATDTVRVAVEARAGLLGRHVIRAEAAAQYTQFLVPQASVVAALGREWQPVQDAIARAKEAAEPVQLAQDTPAPTPDAPAKRKPVNPPTGMTAETLATQGLGLPPEVASGRVTEAEWCKRPENMNTPFCRWSRGE